MVATRTGRHSVLLYRYSFAAGIFAQRTRTLIEPAINIAPVGLTGGSYDTFGQVESQFHVHVAVDRAGTSYVGVRHPHLSAERVPRAHKAVFGEDLKGDPDALDIYVTRVAADGRRLGTSVVTTPEPDELYGLRAAADAAYALGRNERWNAEGTGHDALVARIDGATGDVTVRAFDVLRGDVAFDVAPAAEGRLLVVGASGYTQNPHGASISEASSAFARWLSPDGAIEATALPNGPRHNEARAVLPAGAGRFAVGGMLDGPGTHSADADPAALRATGFVATVPGLRRAP
jgi:hypothetical protein